MTHDPQADDSFPPSPLDPQDWADFRHQAHALLDACVDQLAQARAHPWQPVPEAVRESYALDPAAPGIGYAALGERLRDQVLPYATGNGHPRFFGWVHGTGLAEGLLADMVASAMNSNCGGRDHGAVYVERAVIDWCRQVFGFPADSSGLLVAGTSQATVIALACARQQALGPASRQQGIRSGPMLTAYAAAGAHNAVRKALELLGLGAQALRSIATDGDGAMDLQQLAAAVAEDRAHGAQPFCVIGTAGSVDLGCFDRLDALADFCAQQGLWFHIDGAFGAWARMAEAPWQGLAQGLERADSLAFDFHKWMYVQYDCGAVLIRDQTKHRATFAARPAYLAGHDTGLAGGEPWFCDYGTDLSRGFRALRVWAALQAHGRDALGAAITHNCQLAARMQQQVEAVSPLLRLSAPVRLNVCCFSAAPADWAPARADALNSHLAQQLQLDGDAVFSTTHINGRTVLRAAIVNHRTQVADIDYAIAAVLRARQRWLDSEASLAE